MLRKLLIVPVLLFVGLMIATIAQPAELRVTRERSIAAPQALVFAQVADFRRWESWSPWEQLDPHMAKQHEGEQGAPGAKYSWQGNEQVGKGAMTLQEVDAPNRLAIELAFIEPWEATNQTVFTFAPDGDKTRVTWTMISHNDFMGKLFSVFMDMDSMVGPDFERGLETLDTRVVGLSAAPEPSLPAAGGAPDAGAGLPQAGPG